MTLIINDFFLFLRSQFVRHFPSRVTNSLIARFASPCWKWRATTGMMAQSSPARCIISSSHDSDTIGSSKKACDNNIDGIPQTWRQKHRADYRPHLREYNVKRWWSTRMIGSDDHHDPITITFHVTDRYFEYRSDSTVGKIQGKIASAKRSAT